MEMCHSWKCPGCGALVALPALVLAPVDVEGEKKLDRLAQASCACWVAVIPEWGMNRLLEAIANADDDMCRPSRVSAGRRA
jgi:hypothetical protein